jgi:SAM-dependent methyltransferase
VQLAPQRLHDPSDIRKIEMALTDFYRRRPAVYHIDQVAEKDLEQYASFVSQFAPKGAKLLEFGAGSWRLPATLARYGFKVTGCDIFSSDDLDRFSRHLQHLDAELVNYDGQQLPFENATFEVISSRNVFEHIIHVERMLEELDRVLKPEGIFIIYGPNWSGPNNAIRALLRILRDKQERYWHYQTSTSAFLGLLRSVKWYFEVKFSKQNQFLLVFPRMKDGQIDFVYSDDDAVHLCQPLSFKKWFLHKSYHVRCYNCKESHSNFGKHFNKFLPSLATMNAMVFQKGKQDATLK